MFGTWRVSSTGNDPDPTILGAELNQQKACDSCRAKKLKCLRQISGGCKRCESLDTPCTFLANTATKRRGRRGGSNGIQESPRKKQQWRKASQCPFTMPATSEDDMKRQTLSPPEDVVSLPPEIVLLTDDNEPPDQSYDDGSDDIFSLFTESETWAHTSFSSPPTACSSPSFKLAPDGGVESSPPQPPTSFISRSTKLLVPDIDHWPPPPPPPPCSAPLYSKPSVPTPPHTPTTKTTTNPPIQSPYQRQTASNSNMSPPQHIAQPCRCLQNVIFLINELETKLGSWEQRQPDNLDHHPRSSSSSSAATNNNNSYEMVSRNLSSSNPKISTGNIINNNGGFDLALLEFHKLAIHEGESMRRCLLCSSLGRADEMRALLFLLANRLAKLCSHMVTSIINQPYNLFNTSGNECGTPTPTTSTSAYYEDMLGGLNITVGGSYKVESGLEKAAVLQELVAFQLGLLHEFVSSFVVPSPITAVTTMGDGGDDDQRPQLQPAGPLTGGAEFAAVRDKVKGQLLRLRKYSRLYVG